MYVEQGAKKSSLVMGLSNLFKSEAWTIAKFMREEDEGVSSPYMEQDKWGIPRFLPSLQANSLPALC